MSIALMTAAWALPLGSTDKLTLLALADWSNAEGRCWPSMAKLAAKSGLTDRALRTAVGRLCAAGHLTRTDVPGKGVNYTVHPGTSFPPELASPRNETSSTPERRSANTLGNTSKRVKATPSPSPRSLAKPGYPAGFEEFWLAYPRRTAKGDAAKAWTLAARRADPATILAAARAYALHAPPDPQFIPHPATWLNGGRYDDPIEEISNVRSMGRNDRPAPERPTETSNPRILAGIANRNRLIAEQAEHDARHAA